MSYGFVYVLGNPCFPGIYKVGMTSRSPSLRCKELSKATAAPSPFIVLAYYEFDDARAVEQSIHGVLADFRVSDSREFFDVSLFCIAENLKDDCLSFYESDMVQLDGMGHPPFSRGETPINTLAEV